VSEAAPRDVARLNAFTDGVLVVSMTLLVLNIELPDHVGTMGDGELWETLRDLWPRFLAYLISFLVVAQYWVGYTDRFAALTAADLGFVWRNIWFLLVIGFIPFASGLISENGSAVATIVYAATMIAASLMLTRLWLYATAQGLLAEAVPAERRWRMAMPWLLTAGVFGLSIGVALFSADIAKLTWLLLVPLGWWNDRWEKRRR
jgi:uncharacterized membrane protein